MPHTVRFAERASTNSDDAPTRNVTSAASPASTTAFGFDRARMTFGKHLFVKSLENLHKLPSDTTLAFLFPGQGSQKVGMGVAAYRSSGAAREVFDIADRALQLDLSRLCFEGPEDELTRTVNAQPAILATSIALLAASIESGAIDRRPALLAGHSLGEYTALVTAGSLKLEDALMLVRERGRLMEMAGRENPGTMAAIVGLPAEQVKEICRSSGAEPCNFNARTQVVIGGTSAAVSAACALSKVQGGRCLPMNVAGAFHTSLMAGAARKFRVALEGIAIDDPILPVMSNVTARAMTAGAECTLDLAQQIAMPVLWHQTILYIQRTGVKTFVELGPGRALITMLKRDAPELSLSSLDGATAFASPANV